jgi:hypothetical protein
MYREEANKERETIAKAALKIRRMPRNGAARRFRVTGPTLSGKGEYIFTKLLRFKKLFCFFYGYYLIERSQNLLAFVALLLLDRLFALLGLSLKLVRVFSRNNLVINFVFDFQVGDCDKGCN